MITHSSNLATNLLITRLDPVRITALTREFGATQMLVRRGVEDNLAFRAGLNNTATANGLVALFVALHNGRVANAASTRDMLAILEAQAFNDEIPAGLPKGTRVAHKRAPSRPRCTTRDWCIPPRVHRTPSRSSRAAFPTEKSPKR